MDSIPRIETERLTLRAVFPSDAQSIFQLLSDPTVAQHHELEPFETVHQAHLMISNFTKWFQKRSGRPLGDRSKTRWRSDWHLLL